MKILITGCAGFIGYHLAKTLLEKKLKVYGIDNLNNYYDQSLKKDRLKILKKYKNFQFYKLDLKDKNKIYKNFKKEKYKYIFNLAAQAGVRYSISNPEKYFDSNLTGFFNLIEAARFHKVKHIFSASTSSVYGKSKKFPLEESFNTDKPLSFYAATKKCNEVLAYSYANIYKINITMLRFFTVYGPYGRPDMSLYKFVYNILNNKPIELYNNGDHIRDFTYVDDVIFNIFNLFEKAKRNKLKNFDIINIVGSKPKTLKTYVNIIKNNLEIKFNIKFKPLQTGDVYKTHGSNKKLLKILKKSQNTNLNDGIFKFIKWFLNYYKLNDKKSN